MIFKLSEAEIELLAKRGIPFTPAHDYTEDEALELLEKVREVEVEYAQDYGNERERLFFQYGDLADKIHMQIPEV